MGRLPETSFRDRSGVYIGYKGVQRRILRQRESKKPRQRGGRTAAKNHGTNALFFTFLGRRKHL